MVLKLIEQMYMTITPHRITNKALYVNSIMSSSYSIATS